MINKLIEYSITNRWLVLAVAGVFVVVLNVFRRPDQIKRLLMAIALIGGVIAVITIHPIIPATAGDPVVTIIPIDLEGNARS